MKLLPCFLIALALLWSAFAESESAQALTNSNDMQTAAGHEREANPSGLFASEDPFTVTQTYKQTAEKIRTALKNDPRANAAQFILFVDQPPTQSERPPATSQTNNVERIELPKAQPAEQRRRFETAVSKVLEAHGFTPPLFVQKPEGLCVAVCSRPRLKPLSPSSTTSGYEILQAKIETTSENHVTVELVPYFWVATGYAILGKLFEDGMIREREEIARQLRAELSRN